MSKLTKSARLRECQIRIPGVCNRNDETTVLAHLNGAGWGLKHDDRHGAFACSACHDAVDGRIKTEYANTLLKLFHLEGVIRTQQIWIKEGLM